MTSRLPLTRHPRPLRGLGHRLVDSPLAQDLTRHGWTPLVLAGMLVVSLLVALLTRGWLLTWDGYVQVPTESVYEPLPIVNENCGDYCGSDAGLL